MSEIKGCSRQFAAQTCNAFGLKAMFLGEDQEQCLVGKQMVENAAEKSGVGGAGPNRLERQVRTSP